MPQQCQFEFERTGGVLVADAYNRRLIDVLARINRVLHVGEGAPERTPSWNLLPRIKMPDVSSLVVRDKDCSFLATHLHKSISSHRYYGNDDCLKIDDTQF